MGWGALEHSPGRRSLWIAWRRSSDLPQLVLPQSSILCPSRRQPTTSTDQKIWELERWNQTSLGWSVWSQRWLQSLFGAARAPYLHHARNCWHCSSGAACFPFKGCHTDHCQRCREWFFVVLVPMFCRPCVFGPLFMAIGYTRQDSDQFLVPRRRDILTELTSCFAISSEALSLGPTPMFWCRIPKFSGKWWNNQKLIFLRFDF